jgi:hypothetical protein
MPSSLLTRRIHALNVMGMLFLAVAVFTWGLQYKMSLYNASSGLAASVPHAKLLSEKERPESNVASIKPDSTQDRSPFSYTIFLFASIVCSLVVAVTIQIRSSSLDKGSRQQRFAALDFFSFRPPPVLLPSN